ncbi:hypothetical protein FA15DRAFT_723963 [Coprinopsis marcescibilis]|uniref:Uncharacterized protein n=1 Tax=Coprinopsis marcescibilis TaxID=230819 RepID=A0A5C3L4F1_COPMA|nr:hypothetical protein FA15DRAFT_723963 [Coprinopsis marcescibilis]
MILTPRFRPPVAQEYISTEGMIVARWGLLTLSLSMSITGLISAAEGTLSTLDALVLAHILVIPDVASVLNLRNYYFLAYVPKADDEIAMATHNLKRGGAGTLLPLLNWLQSGSACAYGLYVARNLLNLGTHPECNRYLKWSSPSDIASLQKGLMGGWAILAIYFCTRTLGVVTYSPDDPPDILPVRVRVALIGKKGTTDPLKSRVLRKRALIIIFRAGALMYTTGIYIYIVYTTEKSLELNNAQLVSRDGLSFGQILPLVITVIEVLKLCSRIKSRLTPFAWDWLCVE